VTHRRTTKALLIASTLVVAVLLIWVITTSLAARELKAARERLEEALKTPAYEGYRRSAERHAQLKLPDAELGTSLSLPPEQALGLPLEDASEVVLSAVRASDDAIPIDHLTALYEDVLNRPVCEWSDQDRARIGAYMDERVAVVDALRALIRRGGPVPRPEWGAASRKTSWFGMGLSAMGRHMAAEAQRQSAHSDDETAFTLLHDLMALADRVGDQPVQMAYLKRISLYSDALSAIESITCQREVDPALITAICERLGSAHGREGFAQSLSGAIFLGKEAIEALGDGWPSTLFVSTREWLTECSYRTPIGKAWRYRDEKALVVWGMRYVEGAELPYYELAADFDQDALPELGVVSRTYASNMGRSIQSQANHETQVDLTRLGLLIELYQREHGAFPETLDVLEPVLGGPVPIDPFSGEPYRYMKRDDGFLLYGVGKNRTDEGGFHDYEVGDLVWRGRVDPVLAAQRQAETDRILKEEFGVDATEEGE
jgi:hypothetical protein